MMKKNWILRCFAVIIALVICMVATGCGGGSGDDVVIGGNGNGSEGGDNATGKSYSFVHNNVKITPNDLVDPLIAALGPDYEYQESPSCAFIGMDKIYRYKGFSIYTYPDDKGVDHVLQVILMDDSVSTPEGLMLGHTPEKITQLYGTDYEKSGENYAYTLGKTKLMILVKDGRISSIQYGYTDAL